MSDEGLKPGDIDDPVAQSIRNEQQRDAMPSESELAELEHDAKTCDGCGEQSETTRSRGADDYSPDCPALQQNTMYAGRAPPRLCDDCAPEPQTKIDIIEQHLMEGDDYVIEFKCGVLKPIDTAILMPDVVPGPGWTPEVPIEHRCGKSIKTVWTANDEAIFADE